MRRASDSEIPDRARCGDDLLARIDELTVGKVDEGGGDGNGWRFLLLACGREIGRLRAELQGIADVIASNEARRRE